MKLRLIDPESLIPDAHTAAEAAVRGVEVLIIDHLREKNDSTQPNRYGLPKTNYYAEAAKNVAASVDGEKQVACAPAFSPPAPARLLD